MDTRQREDKNKTKLCIVVYLLAPLGLLPLLRAPSPSRCLGRHARAGNPGDGARLSPPGAGDVVAIVHLHLRLVAPRELLVVELRLL